MAEEAKSKLASVGACVVRHRDSQRAAVTTGLTSLVMCGNGVIQLDIYEFT